MLVEFIALVLEGAPRVIRCCRGGSHHSFSPASDASLGPGFYFTTDPARAAKYDMAGDVVWVDVTLRNPLEGTKTTMAAENGFRWHVDPDSGGFDSLVGAELNRWARAQGHDGIIAVGVRGDLEIVAFDRSSITPAEGPG